MAITYTNIQALSSEFSALSQDRIDPILARASRRCNADFWGDLYDDAVLYLAAHLLSVAEAGTSGPGQVVTGKTVGSIGVTYSAPAYTPEWYNSTSWGREYAALLQGLRFKSGRTV